jgi:hypothetical protein
MSKRTFTGAMLLAFVAVHPACQTAETAETRGEPQPASEKNICVDIGKDKLRCERQACCAWDDPDQLCSPVPSARCSCSRFFDPVSCSAHELCLWDPNDQICETRR